MRAKITEMKRHRRLLSGRRFCQLLCLGIFFLLFARTDYTGSDRLEYAVNILFRVDPFLALVTMLSARMIIVLMLPSLVIVVLALVTGRSFCGWICPMGTLMDACRRISPPGSHRATFFPQLPVWLLLTSVVLSAFGFYLAGYVDPFSILVRGLTQSVYPALQSLVDSFFAFTYSHAPAVVNSVTEHVYSFLRATLFPAEQKYFELVYLSLFMLVAVLAMESVQKRFFCRNVCPLGALLALTSRFSMLRMSGGSESCGGCRLCVSLCRMGAIDEKRSIDPGTCSVCFECTAACPRQIIHYGPAWKGAERAKTGPLLSRRRFISALAAGVIMPSVKGSRTLSIHSSPLLVRPPGALAEEEFLGRCIRCAECIKVCIGNALQPALLEAGLDGMFSPRLQARTGYCEYNCTLCGQVCPTGALQVLSKEEKHGCKIGNGWIDKTLCLPYAKGIPCIVCEEHCPTAEKAIRFREAVVLNAENESVKVKQPYVVDALCIGCGICEFKCPLPGRSAIFVTSGGEQRNPGNRLPESADLFGGAGY